MEMPGILAEQIGSEMRSKGYCLIKADRLDQLWPVSRVEEREQPLRDFAREQGWTLLSYSASLGAMFVLDTAKR